MDKNKWLSLLLSVCMLLGLLAGCHPKEESPQGTLTFLDSRGNTIATADSMQAVYASPYRAYLDIALAEVINIVSAGNQLSPEEAQALLWESDLTVHTAFDKTVYDALANAAQGYGSVNIGCAITDLKGALIAAYSTSDSDNYAAYRASPHSAFKPLSVYAPAMEKGLINWSTPYEDSPYKQLPDSNGDTQPWPANPAKTYTEKNTPIADAIAKSLNTVAVKCLADLGVTESITFLQENFGIPLTQEQQAAEEYGTEEVIGNIALGQLKRGVTAVEMAGYYQIFANGGFYEAPKAVTTLVDGSGNTVYSQSDTPKAILSPATADTMTKLLQGVVSSSGTGSQAHCGDIQVAGKTGTGDETATCWFVGVTPELSCAVLMTDDSENRADSLFSGIIKNIYEAKPKLNKNFITHQNLFQVVYCTESGLAISDGCTSIGLGYYVSTDALASCDIHD